MSPNDRQKGQDTPKPLFTPAPVEELEVRPTGLFDPKPEEVRPWALMVPQEVIEPADVVRVEEPAESEGVTHAIEDSQDAPGAEDEALAAPSEEPIDAPIEQEAATDDAPVSEEPVEDETTVEALSDQADEDAPTDEPGGVEEQAGEHLDELLGSPEELEELLDGTLADEDAGPPTEQEETPIDCPNCEATEAAALATVDEVVEALQLPYLEGSEALQRAAHNVSKDFVQNLLRLSVELAATVLRRTATVDPETILTNFSGAVEIAGPLSELTVRCHPEDAEILRSEGPARAEAINGRLVDITVVPGEGMERGACIVDFEDGLVDARWQVQLDRLADALSPTLIHHAAESAAEIVAETMTVADAQPEETQDDPAFVDDSALAPEDAALESAEESGGDEVPEPSDALEHGDEESPEGPVTQDETLSPEFDEPETIPGDGGQHAPSEDAEEDPA